MGMRLFDWITKFPFKMRGRTLEIDTTGASVGDVLKVDNPATREVSWQAESGGGPPGTQDSLIWCTGVSGAANPFDLTYFENPASAPTIPANKVIDGFTADVDTNITINVEIDAAHRQDQWNPTAQINHNGGSTPITNLTQIDDTRRFSGSAVIQCNATQTITLETSDGGEFEIAFTASPTPPEVTSAVWDGEYPAIPWDTGFDQTAVKEGDVVAYDVSVDVDADKIVLENYQLGTLTEYNGPFLAANNPHTLNVTVSSSTSAGTKWHAETSAGTPGSTLTQASGPVIDQDEVTVSSIGQGDITYPASQFALKNDEDATVAYTLNNWTDVGADPVGSPKYVELDNDTENHVTPSPGTSDGNKIITGPAASFNNTWERIAGGYYVGSANARIRARKSSNGSESGWVNHGIWIAHDAATLTVHEGNSGSAQVVAESSAGGVNTDIGMTFSQMMIGTTISLLRDASDDSDDSLVDAITPSTNATFYDTGMEQVDTDNKGTFSWAATGGVFGTNLAGIDVTVVSTNPTYKLEGFQQISLSRGDQEFTREFQLSTETPFVQVIANTSAERFKDPNWESLTLVTSFTEGEDVTTVGNAAADSYTITNGSGEYDPDGNHFYWLDKDSSDLGLAEQFRVRE